MKHKILIGEMAKLHNISTQTLRYYDKIGLLKPKYIDEDNNYRYYDIEQFALLDSILLLKGLGMSLTQIEKYFSNRNIDSIINLLQDTQKYIKNKINNLKDIEKSIDSKMNFINTYNKDTSFEQCEIIDLPSRKMGFFQLNKKASKVEIEYGLKKIIKSLKYKMSLFNGVITCIIDKKDIYNKDFNKLKSVAILFENNIALKDNFLTIESGKYARIVYRGNIESGKKYYTKLIQWIEENHLKIKGDALLLYVTDATFTSFLDEYITEIQIPIHSS